MKLDLRRDFPSSGLRKKTTHGTQEETLESETREARS